MPEGITGFQYQVTSLTESKTAKTSKYFPDLATAFVEFSRRKFIASSANGTILAKVLNYGIASNDSNLSVRIAPIGDPDNNLPYYLTERFNFGDIRSGNGEMKERVTKHENWNCLVQKLLSISEPQEVILSRGIEVKLEDY